MNTFMFSYLKFLRRVFKICISLITFKSFHTNGF